MELEYPSVREQERSRFDSTIAFFSLSPRELTTAYRYQQLRDRLVELDDRRQQRRRRLDQLRQLQRLLEPFSNPQWSIQPNLITRDGELAQELEKMRMLVARVGGRIGQKKQSGNQSEAEFPSYPVWPDQKLAALFDMDS